MRHRFAHELGEPRPTHDPSPLADQRLRFGDRMGRSDLLCGCAAGAIGRVPWKSLGIPEPKDSAGETLWYAIAGPFRNFSQSSAPITSDTLGDLTVYSGSSATTLTSQAVAVIFAPGPALAGQDRSCTVGVNCTATGQCTTAPASLTPRCNPSNYLEAAGGGNNAQTNGPFVQAQPSGTFNDRLLAFTNAELMPPVEQRVAREMIAYLNAYRAATIATYPPGIYPWADRGNGISNGVEYTFATNHNRFPCSALPVDWNSGGTPPLPLWLTNQCATATGWAGVIYYSVARNFLQNAGAGCTACDTPACTTCATASLTVTNSTNRVAIQCTTGSPPICTPQVVATGGADLVLMTPGAASISPRGTWRTDRYDPITGYFADPVPAISAENQDNGNDNFQVPSTTDLNRARLYLVR